MQTNDNVWVIEDPKKKTVSKESIQERPLKFPKLPKSPAVAFSLSLIIWGAGQFYNGQKKLGFLFLVLMIHFYLFLASMTLFWDSITAVCQEININPSQIILGVGLFYILGLLIWITSAFQAYYKVVKGRYSPFRGIDTALWPTLCSFLFPGWGQLLNGQPIKGIFFIFFSLVGMIALAIFVFVPNVWLSLESSIDRFFYENILSFALLITPLVVLMWFINIYDAVIVSRDPLKKESLKKRMEYATNNFRAKGWKRTILHRMKFALMLTLFLAFSLTFSYSYFPKEYYVDELQDLQTQLSQKKLVIIPQRIGQFIDWIAS